MGYYQIWQSLNDSNWYWRYRANNHEEIGRSSEGYRNKSDCLHSITLMKQSANAPVYDS